MQKLLIVAAISYSLTAQTRVDLRTQAKQIDFSGAASTKPLKVTDQLTSTCTAGEVVLNTGGPAGMSLYACTSPNTWTAQGAVSVASGGTTVGSATTVNFATGTGLTTLVSNTGSEITIQSALDPVAVATQPGLQTGGALRCASSGGSPQTYQCSLNPALTAYTAGMVLHWTPDVSASGGPATLNVDFLGAVPVKLPDGTTDPSANDLGAGRLYPIWYDGSVFRLVAGGTQVMGAASTTVNGQACALGGSCTIGLGSLVVNAQAGASYTLQASDCGNVVTFNNAAAITLTVPQGLGSGCAATIIQLGAGQVTPTINSTTIYQRQGLTKTAGPFAIATLVSYSADVFVLSGDLQ